MGIATVARKARRYCCALTMSGCSKEGTPWDCNAALLPFCIDVLGCERGSDELCSPSLAVPHARESEKFPHFDEVFDEKIGKYSPIMKHRSTYAIVMAEGGILRVNSRLKPMPPRRAPFLLPLPSRVLCTCLLMLWDRFRVEAVLQWCDVVRNDYTTMIVVYDIVLFGEFAELRNDVLLRFKCFFKVGVNARASL